MKRLIKAYAAKSELEKLIGYLVTRRSGLRLNKEHFEQIIAHFESNGGHLEGIKGKKDHDKSKFYEMLHGSIDHILKKHNMK